MTFTHDKDRKKLLFHAFLCIGMCMCMCVGDKKKKFHPGRVVIKADSSVTPLKSDQKK